MTHHPVEGIQGRLTAHQLLAARKPVLTLTQMSKQTGVPVTTLRNWIDKSLFVFDNDRGRAAGKHRRFSAADCALVWLAAALTQQAVTASEAASVASSLVARVLRADKQDADDVNAGHLVTVDVSRTPARIFMTGDMHSTAIESPAAITISMAKIAAYLLRTLDLGLLRPTACIGGDIASQKHGDNNKDSQAYD